MNETVIVTEIVETVTVVEENYTVNVVEESVGVVSVGIQGPAGSDGERDKTFTQSFSGQSVITINHNLGKFPSVTIIDTANDEVEGDVTYNSMNTLTVSFSSAHSGVVYLN